MIVGVAGGVAEYFGWAPGKLRIVWVLAAFLTGGAAIIAYLVCAYLFPPPTDFNINDFRKQ